MDVNCDASDEKMYKKIRIMHLHLYIVYNSYEPEIGLVKAGRGSIFQNLRESKNFEQPELYFWQKCGSNF